MGNQIPKTVEEAKEIYQKTVRNHKKPNIDAYIDYLYWLFKLDGDVEFFKYLQRIVRQQYNDTFMMYFVLQQLNTEQYRIARVQNSSIWYYNKLKEYDLINESTKLFDENWLKVHADDSAVAEATTIEGKTTIEEIIACAHLAIPIARNFFIKFHTDFVPDLPDPNTLEEALLSDSSTA